MTEYVLDTHALLWHLHAPQRLGAAAREALARVDAGEARAWLPAVVVAEALMVAERRRIDGLRIEALLAQLELLHGTDNYRLSPLTPETVLASHRFATIPDIFDRLIVTEAVDRNMPLLSRDAAIRAAEVVETIWD
jgi:PIN domain nuclease of toxin-antitoxin system